MRVLVCLISMCVFHCAIQRTKKNTLEAMRYGTQRRTHCAQSLRKQDGDMRKQKMKRHSTAPNLILCSKMRLGGNGSFQRFNSTLISLSVLISTISMTHTQTFVQSLFTARYL